MLMRGRGISMSRNVGLFDRLLRLSLKLNAANNIAMNEPNQMIFQAFFFFFYCRPVFDRVFTSANYKADNKSFRPESRTNHRRISIKLPFELIVKSF